MLVSAGRLQPDAQPVAQSLAMADVAMGAVGEALEPVDQGASPSPQIAWLIEHEKEKIWKQFPQELAFAVEQAHILTHENTYTHTHTHT